MQTAMTKILKSFLLLTGLGLTLFITSKSFRIPHKTFYQNQDAYVFSEGNAEKEVRRQIEKKLQRFQDGYEARDTSVLDFFMNDLFSQDNILILGTMPNEIYSGYEEATDLVRTDWLHWGDVRLLVRNANISSHGNVAWISTIGFVEFDLSRFLILPLRFSGVLVREDFGWKFQQAQFEFDLDSSFTVMAVLLLGILFGGSVLRFFYLLYKWLRARSEN
jgi:hypothetical protein